MIESSMLFDCTGAGTVVDEWTPLFPVGDVVGHFEHDHWVGTVVATSRPEAHGRHHFHVRWQVGPRGVHEYTAGPLYRIEKGPISRSLTAAALDEWRTERVEFLNPAGGAAEGQS